MTAVVRARYGEVRRRCISRPPQGERKKESAMSLRPWRMRTIAAGVALVTAGTLAACGSSGSSSNNSSSSGPSGVLTVATGQPAYTDDFNLYSLNQQDATNGMIYEPMFFYNTVKSGDIKPWLGLS